MMNKGLLIVFFSLMLLVLSPAGWASNSHGNEEVSPKFRVSVKNFSALEKEAGIISVKDKLIYRIQEEPFLFVATFIFFCAILHTFFANKFSQVAHKMELEHQRYIQREGRTKDSKPHHDAEDDVSFKAQLFHFLGEIEAVFGIWAVVLAIAMVWFYNWEQMVHYISNTVSYIEPMFIVVIMTIASSRPILRLTEQCLSFFAKIGRQSTTAWWLTLLILAPMLGSFITEPAAMTITALLLAKKFYRFKLSASLAYGTLGLLFVNISVGGTLTNFAAPPILMVSGVNAWDWSLGFMMSHFGWKAFVGIIFSTTFYFLVFRKELSKLQQAESEQDSSKEKLSWKEREDPIPVWITFSHLCFLAWTVLNAHHPVLFMGGLLFFLAFAQATFHHQNQINIKPALLVGFFLAGLVIHGGCQGWWISPVISSLGEWPLMIGSTILTSFNDNAAITFLARQVQGLSDSMKYAVVVGAVTGGGLTVIANAPNPAGQSILSRYFPDGINPLALFLGALLPTLIMGLFFMLLPF
jgi:hypothetical protein